ncbi:unnamed protein product [Moneuplotes crassus]|uniref:non-specific serine/threonine protein kinase n=1 Tax=Euplotes crassus TaxID=5936 RepID=A0AAD1X422_EUPCR|nr:unnamed protein product [Moneuplotes crassus]
MESEAPEGTDLKSSKIFVKDFFTEDEQDKSYLTQKSKERFEEKKRDFNLAKIVSEFTLKRENFIRMDGDINDSYEFGKKLGEGAYGIVYKGKEKSSGEERAIKKMSKDKIKNPVRFKNEIQALRTLDHPNIIKLFRYFEDKENIYLVQEYCAGGELFDHLAKADHFDESYAASVFQQILQSIWYCHKNRICHRDLKPENFMLSSVEEGPGTIKLIDFGLSRKFFEVSDTGEKALLRMQTRAGTAFFMAPEVIQGNYSYACDMWSCGCILYLMLSGYAPFDGETQEEIFETILNSQIDFGDPEWDNVSDEAKDLVCSLLTNENDRLTAKAALKHPWFKSVLGKSKNKLSSTHVEKLKNFSNASKVRKIICSFLASRVSNEEVKRQLESFDKLDKNKDGYITLKELHKGLGKKYTIEDAQAIMDSVDTNKNGAIDYNEFLAATLDAEIAKNLRKLEMAFKYFDNNSDGYIDDSELKGVLESSDIGVEDATAFKSMLMECETMEKGKLNYKEFLRCMSIYSGKTKNPNDFLD